MPIKIEQLDGSLKRQLSPVYLFGGEEQLLVQECRDKVREAAKKEGFDEREVFIAGRGFDWSLIGDAGTEPSLFARRKILDVRLPTGKPGQAGAKVLTEFAANPDPDSLLLLSCETWDAASRKSAWAKKLDAAGVRIDIWPVKPEELPSWIKGRMQAAGLQPDREAVMVLADRLEGNLLAAQQEIEKLVLLKGSGPLSVDEVLDSVANSSRFNSFLLAERIMLGDLADGLRVASGLQRTGIPIQLVTFALQKEFRSMELYALAMAAGEPENTVFRKLNIWFNRQVAVRAGVQRIRGKKLAQTWKQLTRMDLQSKGQAAGDPWHELDRIVINLCA